MSVTLGLLLHALELHRFDEATEDALQHGVEVVLQRERLTFAREVRLSSHDRIDFMSGRIGIECKIDGSLAEVTRQLHRYALLPSIECIVLVTTRLRHARVPRTLNGKNVHVVATMGGVL